MIPLGKVRMLLQGTANQQERAWKLQFGEKKRFSVPVFL